MTREVCNNYCKYFADILFALFPRLRYKRTPRSAGPGRAPPLTCSRCPTEIIPTSDYFIFVLGGSVFAFKSASRFPGDTCLYLTFARSPVVSQPVQVLLHLSCERRRRARPVTAMCCSLFDFALSSNSYVDSLNDVCSRINMELRGALIKGRKRSPLQAV